MTKSSTREIAVFALFLAVFCNALTAHADGERGGNGGPVANSGNDSSRFPRYSREWWEELRVKIETDRKRRAAQEVAIIDMGGVDAHFNPVDGSRPTVANAPGPASSPSPAPHQDPFQYWDELEEQETAYVSFHVDGTITQQMVQTYKKGDVPVYKTWKDLLDYYLTLPPPPIPMAPTMPVVPIPGIPPVPGPGNTPWDPNAGIPQNIINMFAPLLAKLNEGAFIVTGQQDVLNMQHMLAAAPYAIAFLNGTITFQDLYNAGQALLGPLGLWNTASLTWITQNQNQLQALLYQLYQDYLNLVGPLPSPTPSPSATPSPSPAPGAPPPPPAPVPPKAVNPVEVAAEMDRIWKTKDWGLIGSRLPDLAYSLLRHLDFSYPRVVVYADRDGNYRAAIVTRRWVDGKADTHALNPQGYIRHDNPTAAGMFYQGTNDASLVYIPVKVRDAGTGPQQVGNTVKADREVDASALDVVPSDRYILLKRMAGGHVELVSPARTYNTSMVRLDFQTIGSGNHALYFRGVGGATPYEAMGGAALDYRFGNWNRDIFSGHLAVAGLFSTSHSINQTDLLIYVDGELKVTPFRWQFATGRTSAFRTYFDLIAAFGGSLSRPLERPYSKGERVDPRWLAQGDARVIPQVTVQWANDYVMLRLTGGGTGALVPNGEMNLLKAANSLEMVPIGGQVDAELRVRIGKILNESVLRENPGEFDLHDDIHLVIRGQGQFTRAFNVGRVTLSIDNGEMGAGFVGEVEHYLDEEHIQVRAGATFHYKGLQVTGVHSITGDNDARLQVGLDVLAFTDEDNAIRQERRDRLMERYRTETENYRTAVNQSRAAIPDRPPTANTESYGPAFSNEEEREAQADEYRRNGYRSSTSGPDEYHPPDTSWLDKPIRMSPPLRRSSAPSHP